MLSTILFYVLSALGIGAGIGMVLHRNPMYSVLLLILNFFCIGGLFLTLQAEFHAVIQIIVYAGAIMVLFLFVIMLLNLSAEPKSSKPYDWKRGAALILGAAFALELIYVFSFVNDARFGQNRVEGPFKYGKVEAIGELLMTNYLFAFEMISVILLVALIGAVIIAKKHKA